jgi:hypothetical protein
MPGRTTKLVKATAKELAGAFYDGQDMFRDGRMTRSQRFRIKAGSQSQFVNTYWKDFVVLARRTLAQMLNEPGRSQSDKDAIYDALLEERGAYTDTQLAAPNIIQFN